MAASAAAASTASNAHSEHGRVVKLADMAHILRHKANAVDPVFSVVVFGCFADPQQQKYLEAVAQTYQLLGSDKAVVGFIDVDEVEQDIATPFKIKAIPTTCFYRNSKETARVENADVDALRKAFAAHMPLNAADLAASVAKNYAETDTDKLARSAATAAAAAGPPIRVMNAFYGDLSSGKTVDVTDRVRDLIEKTGQVKVCREELGIPADFVGNPETNVLRVSVDRMGVGKVFTNRDGKTLTLASAGFCFSGHQMGDENTGFRLRGVATDDNQDENQAFEGHGQTNAFAGIPKVQCGG
jgi:hypothetical protein